MAVKNHSLDDKIIRAAEAEFLEHGFMAASMHKIAERAGVTTGALYTRYKNKDALFGSLLEELFSVVQAWSEPASQHYCEAEASGSATDFLAAMEFEEQMYLNLIFEHYEACVLLFCRSHGSSAEESLSAMISHKVTTTVDFLEKTAARPVNREAVRLLMEANFHIYRKILEAGYGKTEAASCMKDVQLFLHTGWKALYEQLHTV